MKKQTPTNKCYIHTRLDKLKCEKWRAVEVEKKWSSTFSFTFVSVFLMNCTFFIAVVIAANI